MLPLKLCHNLFLKPYNLQIVASLMALKRKLETRLEAQHKVDLQCMKLIR